MYTRRVGYEKSEAVNIRDGERGRAKLDSHGIQRLRESGGGCLGGGAAGGVRFNES